MATNYEGSGVFYDNVNFTIGGPVATEEMSFSAPDLGGTRHVVDEAFVRSRLEDLVQDEDLSRFIL